MEVVHPVVVKVVNPIWNARAQTILNMILSHLRRGVPD